jgi:Protein of unknown function (DUF2591)
MKTVELTGAALDWAVCEATGFFKGYVQFRSGKNFLKVYGVGRNTHLHPSTDWSQGGPIIEREKLGVWFSDEVIDEDGNILREVCWYCETSCTADNGDEPYQCDTGPTPLIAAMRCYVASKLGDEVDVPNELTKGE